MTKKGDQKNAFSTISWDQANAPNPGTYNNYMDWPKRGNAVDTTNGNINDFVTWYAATASYEDWADSVAVFIHSNAGTINNLFNQGTQTLQNKRPIINNVF